MSISKRRGTQRNEAPYALWVDQVLEETLPDHPLQAEHLGNYLAKVMVRGLKEALASHDGLSLIRIDLKESATWEQLRSCVRALMSWAYEECGPAVI